MNSSMSMIRVLFAIVILTVAFPLTVFAQEKGYSPDPKEKGQALVLPAPPAPNNELQPQLDVLQSEIGELKTKFDNLPQASPTQGLDPISCAENSKELSCRVQNLEAAFQNQSTNTDAQSKWLIVWAITVSVVAVFGLIFGAIGFVLHKDWALDYLRRRHDSHNPPASGVSALLVLGFVLLGASPTFAGTCNVTQVDGKPVTLGMAVAVVDKKNTAQVITPSHNIQLMNKNVPVAITPVKIPGGFEFSFTHGQTGDLEVMSNGVYVCTLYITTGTGAHSAQIAVLTLRPEMDAFRAETDAQGVRIKGVEQKVDATRADLNNTNSRLDKLEPRVTALEKTAANPPASVDLSDYRLKLNQLERREQESAKRVQEAEVRAREAERQVLQMRSMLDQVLLTQIKTGGFLGFGGKKTIGEAAGVYQKAIVENKEEDKR